MISLTPKTQLLYFVLSILDPVLSQYNDIRCICSCKELVALSIPRKDYSMEAVQEDCNCLHVVLPQLDGKYIDRGNTTAIHMDQYCIGCQCKYEVRSTKTMEAVVILYLVLVGLLLLYMVGVWIGNMITNKKTRASSDQEELILDDTPSTSRGTDGARRRTRRVLRSTSSGSIVMQKLSSAREEWEKTVRNQRDQVYERRSILQ